MCFLGTNLGLFSMQQAGKGQFIELTSVLDLALIHRRRHKESITARAQFFKNLQTDEEKNISTRCKSNRQIESLIVAAQNSIKRCIGLIGANGMQGVGLSMFSQVPQQLPFYFFYLLKYRATTILVRITAVGGYCHSGLSLLRCGPKGQILGFQRQSEFSISSHV